jgi:hypothetical protein
VQFLGYPSHFRRALRVVSVFVERQPQDKPTCPERNRSPHELGDRRSLAGTPQNEAGGRSNEAAGITDGEADSPLAIVDGQQPPAVTCHGAG